MTILDLIFQVEFADASLSFYEKDFARKYRKAWIKTKQMIRIVLEKAHAFQFTSKIDFLKPLGGNVGLYKLDFAVAGTQLSPKSSGNRVVFSLSNKDQLIQVLLIYSKNHLPKNKPETQWIFEMVQEKYSLS